jgi:hypothetical protein
MAEGNQSDTIILISFSVLFQFISALLISAWSSANWTNLSSNIDDEKFGETIFVGGCIALVIALVFLIAGCSANRYGAIEKICLGIATLLNFVFGSSILISILVSQNS